MASRVAASLSDNMRRDDNAIGLEQLSPNLLTPRPGLEGMGDSLEAYLGEEDGRSESSSKGILEVLKERQPPSKALYWVALVWVRQFTTCENEPWVYCT